MLKAQKFNIKANVGYVAWVYNVLVINSELPIMHWCFIKERNAKRESRSEFSTACSLCLSSSVSVCMTLLH